MSFANPVFGVDAAGAFGGIGDNLAANPFGGASLNVGGFGGNIPSYGSQGGFDIGKYGGFLGLANLGLNAMGMRNAANSANQFQQTAGLFGDIAFGRDLYALNKDIEKQKESAAWAAKFKANDPFYSQSLSMGNLGDLAGKYAGTAFGAFASR